MVPLKYIKFIVNHLEGTAFEPWVNGLLFLLFSVAVVVAIRLIIGRKTIEVAIISVKNAYRRFSNLFQYAPEVERVKQKISPYIDLIGFLFMAFIGLYSSVILFLIYILSSKENVLWYGHLVMFSLIIVSLFYMRFNFAKASWSYHQIRKRS